MLTKQPSQSPSSTLVGSTFVRAQNTAGKALQEYGEAWKEGAQLGNKKFEQAKEALEQRIQEGLEKQGKAFQGVANWFKGTAASIKQTFDAAGQEVANEAGFGVDYIRKQAGYKAALDVLERKLHTHEIAGSPTISREEKQELSTLVRQDLKEIQQKYQTKIGNLYAQNTDPQFQRTEFRELLTETLNSAIRDVSKLTANLNLARVGVEQRNRIGQTESVADVYERIKSTPVQDGVDVPNYINAIAAGTAAKPTTQQEEPKPQQQQQVRQETPQPVTTAATVATVEVVDRAAQESIVRSVVNSGVKADLLALADYLRSNRDNLSLTEDESRTVASLRKALRQDDRLQFLAEHIETLPVEKAQQAYAAKRMSEHKVVEK